MNQMRQHLRYTLANRFRAWREGRRLGSLGKAVHIDRNVGIMRFPKNVHIGAEAVLKEGARICSCNEQAIVRIGERTSIGYHTFIFSSASIEIGSDCLIAPFVYIVDSDHQISAGARINTQPNVAEPIRIGNDVWIASHVTILKGVTIGDGAVIAANSVVNRNIEPYEIHGGSPARKIGMRS